VKDGDLARTDDTQIDDNADGYCKLCRCFPTLYHELQVTEYDNPRHCQQFLTISKYILATGTPARPHTC
jgi:hypothetical protein